MIHVISLIFLNNTVKVLRLVKKKKMFSSKAFGKFKFNYEGIGPLELL